MWEIDVVKKENRDPEIWSKAIKNMEVSGNKRKKAYDATRITVQYQVNNKILVKRQIKANLKNKFTPSIAF